MSPPLDFQKQEEAKSAGPVLLQRIARLHHNWKYAFLRPTIAAVVKRYKDKFGTAAPAPAPAAAPAAVPVPGVDAVERCLVLNRR